MLFEKSYSLLMFKPVLLQICAVNSICLWTCHSFYLRLYLKAGAKVQLFFNLARFFEKIFWLFFLNHLPNIFKNLYYPISFISGRQRYYLYFLLSKSFFNFFKVFLTRLILSLCMNFCSNAGAKVEIFFVPTSLFHSFFNVFFDVFLNSLITRI
jgi:hypothetical protein